MMLKTASGYGQVGCCPIGQTDFSECGFRSTCIDSDTFFNSTVCNGDCIHDTHTLKWYDNDIQHLQSLYTLPKSSSP